MTAPFAVPVVMDPPPAFPLTRPDAPRLSSLGCELAAIEMSDRLSNFGPVVTRFEAEASSSLFGNLGPCLTICNATIGLMLALKAVAEARRRTRGYVVMTAFTFAASAQAVLWAGLVPYLIDAEPSAWGADPDAEEAALDEVGSDAVALLACPTFGAPFDLDRYDHVSTRRGVGVVVDAAACLGSIDRRGLTPGAGLPHAVVYSMHATKTFGVGEGGLVHTSDAALLATLRRMSNFGFDGARSAELHGLNGKMSEVAALAALDRLRSFEARAARRGALADAYRASLPELVPQRIDGLRAAYQFMPFLLPPGTAGRRDALQARLAEAKIGTGRYFSPHLGQQPLFQRTCLIKPTPVADDLASRIISLPMSDHMSVADVGVICAVVSETLRIEGVVP